MGVLLHHPSPMTISTEERAFFAGLGERVARLRKDNHITQVELAEAVGVSQQTMQAYEVGRRRIPVSALPVLARTLPVSLEALLDYAPMPPRSAARHRNYSSIWTASASCPRRNSAS